MPFRICKTLEIKNGHMLTHHPDKCRFPHGHSRKVEIVIETDSLDAHGMVCDFKIVKDAAGEFLDSYDHALCMNTQDPMFSTLKEAYGERVIAGYAQRTDTRYKLRLEVRLVRVRVWETSSSWAEYEV